MGIPFSYINLKIQTKKMEKIDIESILQSHCITDDIYAIHPNIKNAMSELADKIVELAVKNISKAYSKNSDLIYDHYEIYKQYVSATRKQVE